MKELHEQAAARVIYSKTASNCVTVVGVCTVD